LVSSISPSMGAEFCSKRLVPHKFPQSPYPQLSPHFPLEHVLHWLAPGGFKNRRKRRLCEWVRCISWVNVKSARASCLCVASRIKEFKLEWNLLTNEGLHFGIGDVDDGWNSTRTVTSE
jgi:hypothetical protein